MIVIVVSMWIVLLRSGWVFLERARILGEIQFTAHFIGFFVVETKRFVSSFVDVVLMRQACGRRSGGTAEGERQALGDCFSERVCCMCLMSECVGGGRSGSVRGFGTCVWRTAAQWQNLIFPPSKHVCFQKSPLRIGSPNASAEVVHSPRSQSPLHFDVRSI